MLIVVDMTSTRCCIIGRRPLKCEGCILISNGNPLQSHPVYGVTKDVSTVEELEMRCQNLDFVYMNALMIRERILGPQHYRMLPRIVTSQQNARRRMGDFRRCIDILKYAFYSAECQCWSERPFIVLTNAVLAFPPSPVFGSFQGPQRMSATQQEWRCYHQIRRYFRRSTIVNVESWRCYRNLSYGWISERRGGLPTYRTWSIILHLVKLIIELDKNEDQLLSFKKLIYGLVHSQPITQRRQSLLHLSLIPCTSEIRGRFLCSVPKHSRRGVAAGVWR